MIYLDNIATTKVIPEAVKVMLPYFSDYYGNSSSIHKPGIKASAAVEKSRILIAEKINVSPEEIFFTSGGTESNNIVLSGLFNSDEVRKKHLIIPGIEHPSVFEYARFLEKKEQELLLFLLTLPALLTLMTLKRQSQKKQCLFL